MLDILGMDTTLTDAKLTSTSGIFRDCYIVIWSLGFTVVMFSVSSLCKRDLFKSVRGDVFHMDMIEEYDEQGCFIVTRKHMFTEAKLLFLIDNLCDIA